MARRASVPSRLTHGPFTVDEALRAGVSRSRLEGQTWVRIAPSTYIWKELAVDPLHRIAAAARRLPSQAAFSGLTAAWLHGLDVTPCDPIEATVPESVGVSARAGIALRRAALPKREVGSMKGFRATSIVRTICELGSRLELVEAVVLADEALHKRRVDLGRLRFWATSHSGHRGIQQLRRVLELAEPAAESPMETRLRMLLVLNGLPRPKAQVPIHDRWGRFLGRPDLFYEAERIGIEYDGGAHRNQLAEDNRRQNRLLSAGLRLLRFTATDVLRDPAGVVEQVRALLASAEPSLNPRPPALAGYPREDLAQAPALAGNR